MDGTKLWQRRFREWMKEFFRYGRYMFNDHLILIVIIAIGAGAYYYNDWVQTLNEDFPAEIIFALLFGWLLTQGNVTTFMREPDKVFLLPVETNLRSYFYRCFLYTYLVQAFFVLFISLVIAPIYLQTVMNRGFVSFLVLLLVLKLSNLWMRWNINYETDVSYLLLDKTLMLAGNGLAIFLFLKHSLALFLLVVILLFLYGVYLASRNKTKGLPWEQLIELEEKRRSRFYQLANLFTDVPHLRNQVKRRKALDFLLKPIPFSNEKAHLYLYTRTFLRSGDYFGLFIRLSVIGGIFVWGLKGTWPGLGAGLLFMYLTGIQLLNLWNHHDSIIWTDIYPFDSALKRIAFSRLLELILWTQNLWFTGLFLSTGDWILGIIFLATLSLFIYLFIYHYARRRLASR